MRSVNSGTILAACLLAALLSAGDEDRSTPELMLVAKQLSSANEHERVIAGCILRDGRQAVIRTVMPVLRTHARERAGQEDDAVWLAVHTLADWQAEEAGGILLQMIDYRARLRSGGKRMPGAAYPCAGALAHIGNRRILGDVTKALAWDDSVKRRKLMAWVIGRLLGEQLGRVHLEQAAEQLDGERAARLLAARDHLAKGYGIFRELGE